MQQRRRVKTRRRRSQRNPSEKNNHQRRGRRVSNENRVTLDLGRLYVFVRAVIKTCYLFLAQRTRTNNRTREVIGKKTNKKNLKKTYGKKKSNTNMRYFIKAIYISKKSKYFHFASFFIKFLLTFNFFFLFN